MYRKEVNQRSPLRVFERSIHGGLGRGNIGVVMGRAGVGKVGFLIGVAIDDLMRGMKTLHIGAHTGVEKLRAAYDEIFHDLAESTNLQDRASIRQEIERNRMIHIYRGDLGLNKVREVITFIRDNMDFVPGVVAIHGFPDWELCTVDDLRGLKEIALQTDCEMWLSARTHREGEDLDDRGIPARIARYEDFVSVIVRLQPESDHVRLELVKDHDNDDLADLQIELDPRTLLLKWR